MTVSKASAQQGAALTWQGVGGEERRQQKLKHPIICVHIEQSTEQSTFNMSDRYMQTLPPGAGHLNTHGASIISVESSL